MNSEPVWMKTFLSQMRRTGNVTVACERAKIARSTAYRYADEHEDFKAVWEEARQEAADRLEEVARKRAVDGWDEPVYQRGELVGNVRKFSDMLLIRLLEANNPAKFRRQADVTSGGEKIQGPIIYLPEVTNDE